MRSVPLGGDGCVQINNNAIIMILRFEAAIMIILIFVPLGGDGCVQIAHLRTYMMDFRGFDSSIILILRGGILVSIGDFPESLSQTILVGIMLVGRRLRSELIRWSDSHFNNPRFKQSQHIHDLSAAHVAISFVSSGILKCRLLKW